MASGVKCREGQFATCEQESRCTGTGAECPKSPPMPDGTGCLERGKCRLGKCIPFCETQGLQSCMCDTSKSRKNLPQLLRNWFLLQIVNQYFSLLVLQSCKRCCRINLNDTCYPVDPPDVLPDGTPCIQGFCNKVFILFNLWRTKKKIV